MEEEERTQYRHFYWPESMERGDLPWEASGAALELLGHLQWKVPLGRPTVRLFKWFWRVTLAANGTRIQTRYQAAVLLSRWERLGDRPPDDVRGIEWYFAFAPWRSREHEHKYRAAREQTDTGKYSELSLEPVPPFPEVVFTVPGSTDWDTFYEAVEDAYGLQGVALIRESLKHEQKGEEQDG